MNCEESFISTVANTSAHVSVMHLYAALSLVFVKFLRKTSGANHAFFFSSITTAALRASILFVADATEGVGGGDGKSNGGGH